MENHKKRKYVLITVCIVVAGIISACGKKTEESFDGWGGLSNLACEGADEILFGAHTGYLYTLDKKTGIVSYLCKDPACAHDYYTRECISHRSITHIQYFNGCYYFEDMFDKTYFKLEGDTLQEIRYTGENGFAYIYNNK